MGHVQHALNLARRVETKLAKLRTEQLQRSRGWEKYVSDVKETVARERSRHEAAQARISKEILDLEASQAAAYEQVTMVALEMQNQGGTPGPLTVKYAETDGMDVDIGLDQREPVHAEGSLSDADLAAELRRIVEVVRAQRAGRPVSPSTPPRRPSSHPAMTPPAAVRARPGTNVDPYPTPPGAAHFGTGPSSADGGPPVANPPETAPADGEGMREVPLPVPPASTSPLQEQLRAKRKEARRAMEPFGIPGKLNQPGPPSAPDAAHEKAPSTHGIIQDDDEELDVASTLSASPGLGKLE